MFKHEITQYEEVVMIANVFRKNGINLVYGASGLGKTVSSVKAINADGIKPILLDFDNNMSPENNGCEYSHINGGEFMKEWLNHKSQVDVPNGYVIIVDTWATFEANEGTIDHLRALASNGNTIIIIAHNLDLATRRDIPDMPAIIVNHIDSKLYLDHKMEAKTGKQSFNLHVMKCRGYQGPRVIENWMRVDEDREKIIAL